MKRLTAYAEEIAVAMVMLALFATSGCTSDKAFLADSAAERIYREDAYERKCVVQKGPVTCATAQTALNLLERHDVTGAPVGLIQTANQVQKLGKMPAAEKAEIKAALAASRMP